METIRVRCLAAAAAAASIAAAAKAQFLADGSFEISGPLFPNPAPWAQSSTNFGTPLCNGSCTPDGSTFARTGVWWAWFGGNLWLPEHGVLSQVVDLPPGGLKLNFYLKAESERADGADFLAVKIDGAQIYRITDLDVPGLGVGYHRITVDLTAFAAARRTVTFDSITQGNNILTSFYVDDVSIDMDCYANCDGSSQTPILNVNDYQCFLNAYAAGRPYANCDGSSIPPVLNVSDFMCFLNRYTQGCPGDAAPPPAPAPDAPRTPGRPPARR